ncbi:hypothetical protein D3C80_1643890 [compost metagenome]
MFNRAYRYLRRHTRKPISSASGVNSSGRWIRPSLNSLRLEVHGRVLICFSRRVGTLRIHSRSSGLLLGIQNICSSSVARRFWAVVSSCFWLSCRVMDSLSSELSSRFRRSSRSARVTASSSRFLRSCGVT